MAATSQQSDRIIGELRHRLEEFGLDVFGGFHPTADDPVAPPDGDAVRTVVLVGNAGSGMWLPFKRSGGTSGSDNPLEAWIRRIVRDIAEDFGADAVFPSDGPPYHPFQRWAKRSGEVWSSPIGILIHPAHGLWHAYRAALLFGAHLSLPCVPDAVSPCESCGDRPCLTTCPVAAFGAGGYDVPACAAHLHSKEGRDCMEQGCRARRACPAGRDFVYDPAHAEFHMSAFRRNQPSSG